MDKGRDRGLSTAEFIIRNGHLITFDENGASAEALAIADGRIIAVGSNDDIDHLKTADTRVIDAAGNTVLPGFIESHTHLFSGGAELGLLNLADCHSEEALTPLVRDYAAKKPRRRHANGDRS